MLTCSSNGSWLAYLNNSKNLKDRKISNRNEIWLQPTSGGKAIQLTRTNSNINAYAWSKDDQTIAFSTNLFGFYDISTKVLAASIRSTLHCLNAAKVGADVATVPFDVLMQMAHHPLTDAGAIKFLEDWKKVENSKK